MIIDSDGTPTAELVGDDGDQVTDLVEEPAKVMRIGSMIRTLLEEVKAAPVDEAGAHPPRPACWRPRSPS